MKPFRFRLETLLDFRRLQKEQAQLAFMQATNQLQAEKERLKQLEGMLAESMELLNVRRQQPLPVEVFKSYQYYFDKIGEDIHKQNQCVMQATNNYQACLSKLAEAEKEHKIVEKFREKKLQNYQLEVMNEEQKVLDEIGLQIYTRDK